MDNIKKEGEEEGETDEWEEEQGENGEGSWNESMMIEPICDISAAGGKFI